jgi:iron complex transport system ATP-binding protein
MDKQETVKVVNLTTGYNSKKGDAVVTRDINASLYPGELTCLLGPNGAGKSTLLKTLTAFLAPINGEIIINGTRLKDYTDPELAKAIGVVLTDKISLNNLSVDELIGMGRSPYTGFWGRMSGHDRKIVAEAIEAVGIDKLRGRMTQTLSDGERQKVMIAKALAQETPIIFLDEPTAYLDFHSKVEIMQLLKKLAREKNKTIFLSTHDLELALQVADKIWLIDGEHGVTIGTPEDLSIGGEMDMYFHREGVVFDSNSGLFKIDNKLDKSVRLVGDGIYYSMARKALARQGIAADENGDDRILIEALSDGYKVNGAVAKSISQLLDIVNENIKQITHD